MKQRDYIVLLLIASLVMPFMAHAASFSYAVWIPYWKKTAAIPETIAHIGAVRTISPFSYEVRSNGVIYDAMKLKDESWLSLMEVAGSEGVRVMPTFSWHDGSAIHANLSSSTKRRAHVDAILRVVDANDFDGVDIDYENKNAETKKYFSQFLTELSSTMHARKKTLTCTIEPRTPAASRFVRVPKLLEYANDFAVMNKVCDEVRLMAYDQGRIDLMLNKKRGKNAKWYAPLADKEWTEKIVKEALKSIRRTKLVLAVPNYAHEYEVSNTSEGVAYRDMRSLSYQDATMLASSTNAVWARGASGEIEFSYTTSSPVVASSTRYVTVSDARAIQDKIAVAKKYRLKGVAVFKVDGESDSALWSVMK